MNLSQLGGARSRRRHGPVIMLFVAVALALSACGTDDATTTDDDVDDVPDAEDVDDVDPTEDEPEGDAEDVPGEEVEVESASIRISFGPSGSLMGPFTYGVSQGIYEQHGIDLAVEDGTGSLVTAQDVAAGNSDFAVMGGSAMAQGISEGMPLISVGALWARPQFGIIVPEDSDIRTFQDMEGKSVIVSPGSPETVLMPAAFEAEGIDQSQVEVISVDGPAKGSSYVQGLGDSVGTAWPYFRAIFAAQGVESRVILFEEAGIGFPEFHIVTRTDVLEERPEMVERFLRATYEALEGAVADPEEAAQSLQDARPAVEDTDVARDVLIDNFDFVCTDSMDGLPVGSHEPGDWSAGLAVLQEFGNLTSSIDDLDLYFTNQFFEDENPVTELTCPWPG